MLTKRHLAPLRVTVLGATAALVASVGVTAAVTPATADQSLQCGISGCGNDDDDGGSTPGVEDGAVSIRVWGTATTGGRDGYDLPPETVVVLPPCRYIQGLTGKEYYDHVEKFGNGRDTEGRPIPPYEGYEKYKDDTEGHWWGGMCDSGDFDGDLDEFFDYSDEWFDENEGFYVEAGDPPPVPPIPPEVLVEVAYDEMTLPEPEIGWNPKRDGDGATFVNVDTWLWLDDGPVALEINAEAGDNVARVEATLGSMNFSAPNAAPVSCSGTGVEWSPGASSTDCALVFERSSANQPGQVSRVSAESQWDIEWFANGEPRGALDPQTTTATFDVPVAEVQTVVTR